MVTDGLWWLVRGLTCRLMRRSLPPPRPAPLHHDFRGRPSFFPVSCRGRFTTLASSFSEPAFIRCAAIQASMSARRKRQSPPRWNPGNFRKSTTYDQPICAVDGHRTSASPPCPDRYRMNES